MAPALHQPRLPARMGRDRFLEVQGTLYHWVEAGRGPTLLLLPGALDTYRAWNEVMPRLIRRFRCLALDLPGHGDSECPEGGCWGARAQAERLAAFLDAAAIGRCHVAGVFFGGTVALVLAGLLDDRVASVVAVEGLAGLGPGQPSPGRRLAWLAARPMLGWIAERVGRSGLLALPLVATQIRGRWRRIGWSDRFRLAADHRQNMRALSRERIGHILRGLGETAGIEDAVRAIRTPGLHLTGSLSPYRPLMGHAWRVLRAGGVVQPYELVGVGDSVHLEHPAWLAATLEAFFRFGRRPPTDPSEPGADGVIRLRP